MAKPTSIRLLKKVYSKNILARMEDVERTQTETRMTPIQTERLSNLSEDLGTVTSGSFIAPSSVATSVEPTDSGFTGSFMSGTPVLFGDDSYNVGTVAGGVFAAGFNTSGKFKAAFGEYTVDESGTLSEGLTFLHQFDATYNGIRRQGYIGMFVPAGGDRPSLRIYYNEPAASNLVANGSFESGDETSWTDTNTTWAVAADATYGYCDRHDGTATGCPPTLTQAVSVSASTVYQFSFASKMSSGYIPCAVSLIWKDGGSSVVRTDTIIGGTSSAWSVKGSVYTSPSTAATVTISIHAGEIFSDVSVTAFSLYALTSYSSIDFYDGKILADAYSGKPANLLGLPQTDMQFAQQMVFSATTATTGDSSQRFGFYIGPSAANANDGDTIDMQFVVAAGTYTFTVSGVSMNACGKTDGYVDGSTSTSWTGDDWYSVVLTNNVTASHSVTFTTGGRHTIRLKVNGKNGSSADYRVLLTNARLVPTSYSVEA